MGTHKLLWLILTRKIFHSATFYSVSTISFSSCEVRPKCKQTVSVLEKIQISNMTRWWADGWRWWSHIQVRFRNIWNSPILFNCGSPKILLIVSVTIRFMGHQHVWNDALETDIWAIRIWEETVCFNNNWTSLIHSHYYFRQWLSY